MTLTMACLLVTIGVFGVICLHLNERIKNANFVIDALATKVNYLEKKADLNTESIELQNISIRELLKLVKKVVECKETTEPDTKALISGWDADETEPEDPVKKHMVDIMLNGTYEQKQDLIDARTLQSALSGQIQQCIYPLQTGQLQSSAMLPPQQCIYPWQQTPSGAMLPLWYMNRRLEDM